MEQWVWRKEAAHPPLSLPATPPSHCPFLDDTADVIKIVPKPLHSSPQHLYLRLRPLGTVRGERGTAKVGGGGVWRQLPGYAIHSNQPPPTIPGAPPIDP